jgi:hypothetical protein
MSTLKTINIIHPSGSTNNIVNDASGNITVGGNVTLSGTAVRITGDMSNATLASRVALQTSTVNGITTVAALPNGTQTISSFSCYNNATPSSGQVAQLIALSTEMRLTSAPDSLSTYLPMTFHTGGSERMRIDTSGNVGIGTSSPSERLTLAGATNVYASIVTTGGIKSQLFSSDATGGGGLGTATNHFMALYTNNTERMRIDTNGNLLINQTTADGRLAITTNGSSQTCVYVKDSSSGSNAQNMFYFVRNTTNVGTIQTTNTATSYNTSSDYRLKHSAAPMTTGLATISALKPVTYKWNVDNSDGEGFIAHELQSVIPHAVSGVKDAVETIEIKDEEGNVTGTEEHIKPQGVDYSKIVVHLVAAIQEQQATITALTARVAALEAKQ